MRRGYSAITWATTRCRLPAAEVVHLGAQLPTLVRGIYYDGWRLANHPEKIHSRADMLERVQRELGSDRQLSAVAVLSAVIALVRKHVSAGEVDKLVATLPHSIGELWS